MLPTTCTAMVMGTQQSTKLCGDGNMDNNGNRDGYSNGIDNNDNNNNKNHGNDDNDDYVGGSFGSNVDTGGDGEHTTIK